MRLALEDRMRGGDDAALFPLSVDGVEPGDFCRRRGHEVTKTLPAPTEGNWSASPTRSR